MTPFWQGFISAVALIAVAVIVLSVVMYRRQERQRQQAAIMAKVESDGGPVGHLESYYRSQHRDARTPHMAPPSGKKGLR